MILVANTRKFATLLLGLLLMALSMAPMRVAAADLPKIDYYQNLEIINKIASKYLDNLNLKTPQIPKRKQSSTRKKKINRSLQVRKQRKNKHYPKNTIVIYSKNCESRKMLRAVENCTQQNHSVYSSFKQLHLDIISLGLEPVDLGLDPFFGVGNNSFK